MKAKILIILFLVVIATACKKKAASMPKNLKTYLSKQIIGPGTYTWSYDLQNKVVGVDFVSNNERSNPSFAYKVTSLNNQASIVEALIDYVSPSLSDLRETNTYNGEGVLIRVDHADGTGVSQGYRTQQYVGNQVKLTYYNASNTISSSTIYTQSADGKNVVEIKSYNSVGTLLGTTAYSNFDNKKNIQSLYPKGYSTGIKFENNYQTEIFTNAGTGVSTTYTYTYDYNEDGYVTKRTSASGATISFEYFKK